MLAARRRLGPLGPFARGAWVRFEGRCDLPGLEPARAEVCDVSRRRVNQREVSFATAGTQRIEGDLAAKMCLAVYCARVGEGLRPPVTRAVVVGR